MAIDKILKEMIRDEIERSLIPISHAIAALQQQGDLSAQLGTLLGQPVKRGPGRPRKAVALVLSKRPRGRPKGSKNKAKKAQAEAQPAA